MNDIFIDILLLKYSKFICIFIFIVLIIKLHKNLAPVLRWHLCGHAELCLY